VAGALHLLEYGDSAIGDTDQGVAIPLTSISKFNSQGLPNNEKTYQDLVVEHNTGGTTLTVKALINFGATEITLGTIASIVKTQTTFQIPDASGNKEQGRQGMNFAALIEGDKLTNESVCELYGVFLHWYPEARKALTWDSDEGDDGTQKVKAYRAIELDLNNPGAVTVLVYTDMPGNAMALRSTKVVPASTTRRKYQVPLGRPYLEGRHRRVIVKSGDGLTEFQLYGGRIEAQPFGEYVEGYEATAGREWDSGTLDLGSPSVKEIREVQLDVDTDGSLTFDLHTELPGLSMVSRATKTVNTELTTAGRRMMNLPLLTNGTPVEGRLVRNFLRGSSAWRLYGAWLFCRPIGYYVEAYQAVDGHIWDSTVLDLGTQSVKRFLQVYLEAHADSALTVKVYTSNAAGEMTLRQTDVIPGGTGRKPYVIPLTSVYGRLVRITVSSTGAFRLFKARISAKPIGVYLNGGSNEVFPCEAEQDLASERVKMFKEIELVYANAGVGTLAFATDLPNTAITTVKTFALAATSGAETHKLRLPQYCKGRLLRVEIRPGSGDLQIFACRVWTRTIGESGQVMWTWVPLPIPATPENYAWAEVYVAATPPAYSWVQIYVAPTQTEAWNWADLPVSM
jgi:hypothetical protein